MKPQQVKRATALSIVPLQKKNADFFKPAERALVANQAPQSQLRIGPSDDTYEREADSVADHIVATNRGETASSFFGASPGHVKEVQRMCAQCEEEKQLQKKETSGASAQIIAPETVQNVLSMPGESLDRATQDFMQSEFSVDFGNVRIHNDSVAHRSSDGINARAFTHGNHIVFGEGEYQPNSDKGRHLLAHELTHVVQQGKDNTIRRQEKPKKDPAEKQVDITSSYIFLQTYGQIQGPADIQGIADKELVQKIGDIYRDKKVCWGGDYVGIELFFGTSPIPGDGSSPRQIPPFISAKLSYKEAGGFTSYRYEGSDAAPQWYPGAFSNITANWHPNIQTFFTYPLNRRGTLNIHLEMMDIDDDRLLIYDDSIDFIKCNVVTGCRENSIATDRWAVLPDKGGPFHPASKKEHDDGPRYEIFKEDGKNSYFVCIDEVTRRPVTREGDQL